MIPYGRQEITAADEAAVLEVLRSDYLTTGPKVPEFEHALRTLTGAEYAFAMNSATSALHVACLALGLGPGRALWVPAITFAASANCARLCGAPVDFVDVDPLTCNIDVAALEARLVDAERDGMLPAAVMPVHMGGSPCEMSRLLALRDRFGFRLIEDASHAIGAHWDGAPIGSGRWSDATIFSFHPVKIITTAEGGALLCNDPELATRVELLRTHGITRRPDLLALSDPPGWHYEQHLLGLNYRMTDLQAALGCSQLHRLEDYIRRRNEIAGIYRQRLAHLPLHCQTVAANARSSYHLFIVQLRDDAPMDRRALFDHLRAAGIGVNVHYIPVYHHPYYRALGFRPGHCPGAETYYARALSIPMFATLSEADQTHVIETIDAALS